MRPSTSTTGPALAGVKNTNASAPSVQRVEGTTQAGQPVFSLNATTASKRAKTAKTMSGHPPTGKNASQVGFEPPALTKAQSQRLTRWGIRHRGLIKASWAGTATKRQAIQAQCLECAGEDHQAIADCGDRCCPLWRFRPYATVTGGTNDCVDASLVEGARKMASPGPCTS